MKTINTFITACALFLGTFSASAQYNASVSGTLSNMKPGDTATIYIDSLGGIFSFANGQGIAGGPNGAYTINYMGNGSHNLWVWTVDCKGDTLVDSTFVSSTRPQVIVNFNYCSNTPPPPRKNSIVSGTVYKGGNVVTDGTVILVEKVPGILTAVDTFALTTGTGGSYSFNIPDSTKDYLVKAFLNTTNADYFNYFPTYSDSALKWSNGHTIAASFNQTITRNINLVSGMNPGGPGFIGGLVLAGANKNAAEGDPIAGAQVMVLQNNMPVAYALSAADGAFKIDDLAYGTYTVYTEVAGKPTVAAEVTLSSEKPNEAGVKVSINSAGVTTSIEVVQSINESITANWKGYPNPVANNLTIDFGSIESEVSVALIDAAGRTIQTLNTHSVSELTVPMSTLDAGTYFVQIQTENAAQVLKVTKQ